VLTPALLVFAVVMGAVMFAALLAGVVWWLWFAPLYHPLFCDCRRRACRDAATARRANDR
jgi:hypothetical protein